MKIETQSDKVVFPAFFNKFRYGDQAISRIVGALVDHTTEGKEYSPIFTSRFEIISPEGAPPQTFELAMFAATSASGNPYLRSTIKPYVSREVAPKQNPNFDDCHDEMPF